MSAPRPGGAPAPDQPPAPTPEQLAERRVRANRATRGAGAAILSLEAVIVLLVPRTIARTGGGLSVTQTVLLVVFAVLLVTVGALLRRPWGIGAGSALHVPLIALGAWVPVMYVLGVVFLAIWLWLLSIRHDLVGTPGGIRMLVS